MLQNIDTDAPGTNSTDNKFHFTLVKLIRFQVFIKMHCRYLPVTWTTTVTAAESPV